ncbi:MAG: replicative DNA helicase [Pseudohongiellaceae bacterium]|jgi:replicative DNA helicase
MAESPFSDNKLSDAAIPRATSLKLPPHSVDAEQSVLGALMLDNSAWHDLSEIIIVEDFYRKEHYLIFQAMQHQAAEGSPIDLVTLSESLDNANNLDKVGGVDYLGELVENSPSSANILAYAKIIRERAILRKLISAANAISENSFNPDGRDSIELLDLAEKQVFKIADDRPRDGGPQIVGPILDSALERIDKLFAAKGSITGMTTGFKGLDEMTSGLQKSDLVIVAGRPSMGKTSFAMNMVESAILNSDSPIVVFSLEMPAESLVMRMLSSIGRIDQTHMRNGQLEEGDWDKLTNAVHKIKNKPLFIDDTAGLSPMEMRSRARRIWREHGHLGMIMVDYLQLMQVKGTSESRTGEISEISRSLKTMAREFDCPVVALSQLNRSLEQRPNKRPVMSDLRESGAIEQDADVIMFVYRDEVYNEDSEHKGVAEIIIGKQRNGPIGTKLLSFVGKYTRFENYMPLNDDFGGGYGGGASSSGGAPSGSYGQAAMAPSSKSAAPNIPYDAFSDDPFEEDD